ncbi:MAG: hypothetical protein ACE5EC_07640 [Phycisphaerae bacterium]
MSISPDQDTPDDPNRCLNPIALSADTMAMNESSQNGEKQGSGGKIDIVSSPPLGEADNRQVGPPTNRPWVGIHFECCDVYDRIYRDADSPAYVGRCPRCGRPITIRVDPEGVDSRILRARPI